MIKKFKKIKNLGIFSDYSWDSHILKDFERYNIFYGWNGTGKTTLTKLFSGLENGGLGEYPELEYEVDTDGGGIKQGNSFSEKVRVFNQEFIDANIEISGSKAKPIFILGEENKKLKEDIDADEISLKDIRATKKTKTEDRDKKEEEKGGKFTSVAKIIGANLVGSSTRNYRKPDAEKDFALLTSKTLLDKTKLQKCLTTLKEEQKEKVSVVEYEIDLDEIYGETTKISLETVSSITIDRLKEYSDISLWVEAGINIHQTHESKTCEFCQQKIPPTRLEELLKHFNDADKQLKEKLDEKIAFLTGKLNALNSLELPNKALLYTEIQTEYTSRLSTFNIQRTNLSLEISTIIKQLEDKKTKTTESLIFEKSLTNTFPESLVLMNETLSKHNTKTDSFQIQKDTAYTEIKNHYLSEIYDEVHLLDTTISNLKIDIDGLEKSEKELAQKITTNKATISSEHKACEILNKKLETFLGRKEITFEVSPAGGYILKRHEKVAKNLSEGEKTAVAFIYFVVHLEDQNFNLRDGIVVIDDPISSLDSNSLFQAFAFLKTSVENAKQIFILTHNFDFLRLLLNWVKNIRNSEGKKSYYMIGNGFEGNKRTASIKSLDTLLTEHESEYHYLCKVLYEFKTDGTIGSVYHIPNIARKALETFLMFRVPSGESPYSKLETLTGFDKEKRAAIYKFTNDQSHITGQGFDPSLVPETQKNVEYLLEMIKETSPEHYDILIASFTP